MPSGEEIQRDLARFAADWRDYAGSERGEAQTFLNELLVCYGTDRRAAGATFEDAHVATGIVDMHWPGLAIVEMKAPAQAEHLASHRRQALDYWHSSDDPATDRAAPPYVVLCAFRRFEVWEPGRFPSSPRAVFDLDELADRYETLLFLAGAGHSPLFHDQRRELTTEAARAVVALYNSLRDREAASPETVRNFVLQVVWCLFAESLGLIQGRPVEHIVERLVADPSLPSAAMLGQLFDVLNDPDDYHRHGLYAGAPYANGGLFARPAKVGLTTDELHLLAAAADFDWRAVDPTIFGSLMEGFLGHDRRWELGIHYTHEADIMKIVEPTVIRPWRERLAACTTPAEAEGVLAALQSFTVLDPACGCGNFLYVAYREIRAFEQEVIARIAALYRQTGLAAPRLPSPAYPIRNIHGIEVDAFAAMIARVTLWMGHKLAADRYGMVEPPLPLVELDGIQVADALVVEWPRTDAIIGNPPFLGSQHIRRARGDAYIEWLKRTFHCGVKDYCVYWFRKAHDRLAAGGRAGLVGTNSISQNRARSASLDYVVQHGGVITDAVSSQKWPGEAKVHVSLVNWVKQPASRPAERLLDGAPVGEITPELRSAERSTGEVAVLAANSGRCFQGPILVGSGFVLTAAEATGLLTRTDADYAKVVRPYLIGEDITDHPAQAPGRYVIDFGQLPLEQAMRYPAALRIVEERVQPVRAGNRRPLYRQRWWQFGEPRPGLRRALHGLRRFAAGTAQGKRLHLAWCGATVCPSNLTNVFAFDDDYSMGVLLSHAHGAWAWSRSSTLKADLRYTPTSTFATFPWPFPVAAATRDRVASASRRLIELRSGVCQQEQVGLTVLYNRVDQGAYVAVRDAHRELDRAVTSAYGWPESVAQDDDELVRRLLALNRAITAGERAYDPFRAASSVQPELET